jgi:peptide/nickel transport system ATP-binding protein
VTPANTAAAPAAQPLLRVRGLKTWLGDPARPVRAVDGIDLEIRAGETFALLGESGCGKSMTALSIMRLLPPNGRVAGGDVLLDGVPLLDLPEAAMRRERGGHAAMIFQEPMTSLNPVMTVGAQIAEAVRLHDAPARRDLDRRVVELLDAVGIPDPDRRRREYPHQLSGGMKQRVMIAVALAGRPRLLIADEPTTALDVTIQAQVLELLKSLQRESGMAVLLITHDLGVVAEVADRLAVMYAGEIVETATVADFFAAPHHPYSRKLFNALPGADKRAARLEVIPGMVPPLDREFAACRFAERCAAVQPICRERLPPWREAASGGYRCHFTDARLDALRPDEAVSARPRHAPAVAVPLVSVRDLRVHFPIQKGLFRRTVGAVKAVDGVALDILPGRTLALVGESGCGKTTVGKALLRLVPTTGGEILFDGADLARLGAEALRRKRREFQIIFQDPASSMNPRMLVGDIVAEGLVAQGLGGDRAARRTRVVELLDQVGLPASALDRYPHEFSGGQRQRICIARAIALEPRLLVCDEPTSALDVSVQAQVLNLLKALQERLGLSYLFITHDISVVAYIADEVAVMYLGRIVERGTVAEVLDRPAHPYTRALLAAVPAADPAQRRERVPLAGDLPSPAAPPAGCHFHPRCPEARARCREAYPATVALSATHRVACVLHDGSPG